MKRPIDRAGKATCSLLFVAASFYIAVLHPSESPQAKSGRPERSGAYEALDFWTASRAYPAPDVSPDRYFRSYEFSRRTIREIAAPSMAPTTWQFIGPTNFSGRMISVALNPLNPNTIYAGAASGGLWRSYTSSTGGNWQRVSTGFPVLGVNAITIDPADTSVIYIGTGEVYRYGGSAGGMLIRTTRGSYGMGILKTTDGGTIWAKSLDWSYNQERGVQAIRLNPLNRNTLLAATSEGVYRSTDAGISWTFVLSVLMARDLAINPNDTTEVLATCGNFASTGHGVYRSTDGGGTFTQVAGLPSFSGMAVLGTYKANPERIYVHLAESTTVIGTLWRSTNFGENWTLINTSTSGDVQGWYARFLAVHPSDSNKIIRGAQGLWRSANGGTSFSSIIQGWADYHSYAQHPTTDDIVYMVDDGGVWRSTDFGTTFQSIGSGLRTSQFYNGFSSSASDSLRALGQVQDHFGWMYTGSTNWPQSGVDEVGWTAINQQNDNIMYAVTRGGGAVYKSTNRGTSFFSSSSGISGGIGAWNAPIVISSSNPSFLYFGRSRIFKTTNSGTSWTTTNSGLDLDGNPALSMAMSSTNTDSVYVGTAPYITRSHIFRTGNGGTTWTDITGSLPNRYPLDLAVDPNDSWTLYIAFGGFDTSHIFKSTDAGGTWMDITGVLPDVPATAVIVDPLHSDHIYVGTDIGVYLSTDGGTNWAAFNEDLPEAVMISDLSISPSNRALRAATHSNGVYDRALFEAPVGQAPVVTDIPNQTITLGGRFSPIPVDNYVSDPDNPDDELIWTWSGNSNLIVMWNATRRRIRVRAPAGWVGEESVTFTATDPDGNSDSDAATFTVNPASSSPTSGVEIALHGNYPNPFNPTTAISYRLSADVWVTLRIYNTLGEEIATPVNDFQKAGNHSVVWDGKTNAGETVASGVYFYRLTAGDVVKTARLIFAK